MIRLNLPQFLHATPFFGGCTLENISTDWHIQSNDPYYQDISIKYNLNSDSYRSPEWNTINWGESIVIFGCSVTFGVGLLFEDTIGEQLSRLLNRPVINLGCCGSSIFFSYYNSLILKKHFPTPWAVIHLWTNHNRISFFDEENITHLGPWSLNSTLYKESIRSNSNLENIATSLCFSSKFLWDSCKFYSASTFEDTSKLLGCDYIEEIDKARDMIHPGRITITAAARLISRNIK